MKKLIMLCIIGLVLQSCKNTASEQESAETNSALQNIPSQPSADIEGYLTLRGNFIYYEDAAVFQTPREIYGVVLDDKAKELADAAKAYQTADTDMVKATLRVRKFAKASHEEGWSFKVEIKDILKIEPLDNNTQHTITLEQ